MKSRVAILLNMLLTAVAGCSMLPEIAHQPTLHNPFPQLSKVAILFNLSQGASTAASSQSVLP